MTLIEVPKANRTGAAQPLLSTTLCCDAAYWAYLGMAIAKIFVVLIAVTIHAERCAIRYIKSQGGIVSPRLDVVGMESAGGRTAVLACIIVTFKNLLAPFFELVCQLCSWTLERFAVFPRIGLGAGSAFASTRGRAIDLFTLVAGERMLASGACFGVGWVSLRPACFGAVMACCLSVLFHLVRCATDKARFGDLIVCTHGYIIAQLQNKCKYVAVSLERLASMGLSPELVSDG